MDEIVKAFWSRDRWDEANAEVDVVIDTYGRSSVWAQENAENTEALEEANRIIEKNLRRIATESHQMALQRRSSRMLLLAEENYKKYLDYFPDTANAYEMRYWYAEVLYKLRKYEPATDSYEITVSMDPAGKFLRDAAVNTIFAIEKVIERDRPVWDREAARSRRQQLREGATAAEKYAEIDLHEWEQRLVTACDTFGRVLPEDDETANVLYKAAYLLYERNHFVEANERFIQLVRAQPRSELAEFSVNIILDSYNLIEDWPRLNSAAREFYNNDEVGTTERFRTKLKDLYLQATVRIAEGLADTGQEKEAGEAYLAFFEEFQEDDAADADLLQLALYNAGFYAARVGDRQLSLDLRLRFVGTYPDAPDEDSDNADRMLFEKDVSVLGSHYESVANYAEAVRFYELLFERNPDFELEGFQSAQNAVYNTAVFLEAMGEWERANSTFQSFMETYEDAPDLDALRMRMANNCFRNDALDEAREMWQSIYEDDDLVARNFQMAYEARALEARSFWDDGDMDRARGLMRDGLEVFERAASGEGDLGYSSVFAAEMTYKLLGDEADDFNSIQLTADRNARRNLQRKTEGLTDLVGSYTEVIQTGAGEWAIAALVSIGEAYAEMARSLVESPCPSSLTEDQCEIYRFTLQDRAYEPQSKAADAYIAAMEKSFELGLYTDFSAEAARQLEELRPEEYPPLLEEIPEPNDQANPFRFVDNFAN
jgi:tetratricopeptide (TPR) repeat protein